MATIQAWLDTLESWQLALDDGDSIEETRTRLTASELVQEVKVEVKLSLRYDLPSFLHVSLLDIDGHPLYHFGGRVFHDLTTKDAFDLVVGEWLALGGRIQYRERPLELS
jgi:hypothetical protein